MPYFVPSDIYGIGKEELLPTAMKEKDSSIYRDSQMPELPGSIWIRIFVNESNCVFTSQQNQSKIQLIVLENLISKGQNGGVFAEVALYSMGYFDPSKDLGTRMELSQPYEQIYNNNTIDTNLKLYNYYIDDIYFSEGKYTFQARLNDQIHDSMDLNFRKKCMFTPAKSFRKEVDLGNWQKSFVDITIGKGTYGEKHIGLTAYTETDIKWEINIGAFVSIAPDVKIVLAKNTYHNYKAVTTYPFQYIFSRINALQGIENGQLLGDEIDNIHDNNRFLGGRTTKNCFLCQYRE